MVERNKEKEVIEWLDNTVLEVCNTFRSSDDLPVNFNSFVDFEIGKRIPIIEGCEIEFEKKEDHYLKCICSMDKGAVLNKHHHPDFDEFFKMTKGTIRDNISGILIELGMPKFRFPKGIPHEMEALTDCVIQIEMIR